MTTEPETIHRRASANHAFGHRLMPLFVVDLSRIELRLHPIDPETFCAPTCSSNSPAEDIDW